MSKGYGLMIRYGLAHSPSDVESRAWAERTSYYLGFGYILEKAADKAAKDIFQDYETMKYASEAQSIASLLAIATSK